MEELVFRVIAIDKLTLLMDGIHSKAFWAILGSSALFSVPHIPSKSPAELLGIFISSLILGCIYYKSRSILLPAWIHGVANAGYLGGLWIAGLCCLISFADWSVWSGTSKLPPRAPQEMSTPSTWTCSPTVRSANSGSVPVSRLASFAEIPLWPAQFGSIP